MAALVRHIRKKSCPKGKIIVACGSAGTSTCWQLAQHPEAAPELGGLVFIGSVINPSSTDVSELKAAQAKVPIIFAQGQFDGCPKEFIDVNGEQKRKDCGYYKPYEAYVEKLRKYDPNYPARFVMYDGGGHMTPLRMLDWRETLNCMLTQTPDVSSSNSGAPASTSGKPGRTIKD